MRVLLAPDKFKGSLTAAQVAAALKAGLTRAMPGLVVDSLPVADGGEGTVDAALAAGYTRIWMNVTGPTGVPVRSCYARRDDVAVIELANACGLNLLPDRKPAPLQASSRGLGEAIRAAIAAGCRTVVIGLGGSASTDGGSGMLQAMGAEISDACGQPLRPGAGSLADVSSIDLSGARELLDGVKLICATDVDNPLLGATGAAFVFGPQKGAGPDLVGELEATLARWADACERAAGGRLRDVPGAGAAGGVGFGALVVGAQIVSGAELVLDLVAFDAALGDVDLVITGEGTLDEQTLHGKAPVAVAARARRAGIQVVAVCGRRRLAIQACRDAGFEAVYALRDIEPDLGRCMDDAADLAEGIGSTIANTLRRSRPRHLV